MDTFELLQGIIALKAMIMSGASWSAIATKILDIIRKASTLVDGVAKLTDEQKQAFCVEWALKAYDAAVLAITASFANWWLIPLFSTARVLLVKILPGVVDWIYHQTVKRPAAA